MPHSYGCPFWLFLLPLLNNLPTKIPPAEKAIAAIVKIISEIGPIIHCLIFEGFHCNLQVINSSPKKPIKIFQLLSPDNSYSMMFYVF
jgi:hypothetical protein